MNYILISRFDMSLNFKVHVVFFFADIRGYVNINQMERSAVIR